MAWLSQIRVVLFDLGGTLFEHLPQQASEQNLRRVVEPVLAKPLTQAQLQRYHQLRAGVESTFVNRAFFLHKDLVKASITRFLEELSIADSQRPSLAGAFYAAQQQTVTTELRMRADCQSVVSALQSSGRQVGIVSNIDEDYLAPLSQRYPLLSQLSFVLSSEMAKSCKPDPGIYQQALARCSAPAAQVLFVGDSFTNDVLGPARLGMRTCWLPADQSNQEPQAALADLCIASLSDLLVVLNSDDLQ